MCGLKGRVVFIFKEIIHFMSMCVCLNICMCTTCMQELDGRRGYWPPGTVVMGGCELPDMGSVSHLFRPQRQSF